ncbi:MAG: FtsX-like permease family protein [Acidimicrobiales bacterium]
MLKATLASLFARKLRLALTATAIVIGVAFMTGAFVLSDTLTGTFDSLFQEVNQTKDVVVVPKPAFGDATDGTGQPIPAATLDAVRGVEGVAAAEGTIFGFGQLLDQQGKVVTGAGPTLVGNGSADQKLSTTTYDEGALPKRPDQLALDKGTAKRIKAKMGDRLALVTPNGRVDMTVAGIFTFGSSNSLAGATLVEIQTARAQELFDRVGLYDEIHIRGRGDLSQVQLRDRVAKVLPATAQADTAKDNAADQSKSVGQFVGYLRIGLTGFALVALFVGSFIIVNTFSILVAQRTRELGLLRALGASRRQVLGSILGESLGVGVIGSVMGVAGGIALAFGLNLLLGSFFGTSSSTPLIKPMALIVPFALGTTITVIAALYPGIRGSRVTPLAAMRETEGGGDEGLGRRAVAGGVTTTVGMALFALGLTSGPALLLGFGAVLLFVGLSLLLALAARPLVSVFGLPFRRLGTAGQLGLANAKRSPRRTASTASALMVGLALIGGVSTFAASVSASISDVIDRSVRADLVVQPKGFAQGFGTDLTSQIAALPAAARSTPIRTGQLQVGGRTKDLTALDPAATDLLGLELTQGTAAAAAGEGQLLVDETLAKDNRWQVGQQIDVVYARTGPATARIGGLYAKNQLAGAFIASLDTFSRNFTSDLDTVALVNAKPGQLAELRQQVRGVTDQNPTVTVQTRSEFQADQRQQIKQLVQIVYVLLALSVVIAVIGIINTLALSVLERTRELGLLRAVGMQRRQVKRMVRTESVIVAVLGGFVGLAVGVALGAAFVRSLADDGIDKLGLPVGQLLAALVFAGLAGVLAALYPASKAARMDVLRAVTVE